MASTSGQSSQPGTRHRSLATRQQLLHAAAQLISEVGWGRVTTRAVAERAGLPHGAVSYHFHGKQELLTEAAMSTVEGMFPLAELEKITTLTELIPLFQSSISSPPAPEAIDPVSSGVLVEAMRECGRNPELRGRITELLRAYREMVSNLVRAEQGRGVVERGPNATDLATLLIAAGDGLILHALLDPQLPIAGAAETLLALVHT
ncbi:TetR/AcrR family transcriptional regulator [Actinomadura sp. 3N407]|uniref:TetR/AcrR family transcriptional regulator n=1 Tax=Actinomadura sp. 3N407 TaxID=3457423 RepID=UPI003FCCCA61